MSSQHEFFYNICKVDMEGQYWQRLILFLGEGGQLVTTSMNEILYVGGFMGNTPETLEKLSALCADRGVLLQIHSNEHFPEVHECILRHSMRPTELLHQHNVLGPHVLLHHTTLVSEPEIDLIIETDTATSYNPLASIWKGNAVAPALRFAQRQLSLE